MALDNARYSVLYAGLHSANTTTREIGKVFELFDEYLDAHLSNSKRRFWIYELRGNLFVSWLFLFIYLFILNYVYLWTEISITD